MGILGDAFGKLFDVIWDAIVWIAKFFRDILQTVLDVIIDFFALIYALVDGFFYFLWSIGVLAIKLFLLFFEIGKFVVSLFIGFGKTLASIFYTQRSSSGHGYSEMIGNIFSMANNYLQLNVIAVILLFVIWFVFVISAMRIIETIRSS